MITKTFSFVRKFFFPVKTTEISLLFKLGLLLFCVLFNFSALRALKDSLVIPLIGAEAIGFLKLWLVLPTALMFTLAYFKLSNHFNLHILFSIFAGFFVIFFLFFAFFIYPNQDLYHLSDQTTHELIQQLPYLKWFIKLRAKWSYVFVYIFAEIWGAMIINLMFWQLANNIFKTSQAKRLYPMLTLMGSIGLIFAGQTLIFCAKAENLSFISFLSATDNYIEVSIKMLVMLVAISGIIAMVLFAYIYNYCISHHISHNFIPQAPSAQLNIKESIKLIFHSRYILYIFILVVAYGMSINVLEGPWKAKLGKVYNNPGSYIQFMGNFNTWMGITSVVVNLISSSILRFLGWTISAYLTPIIIGTTGTIFFTFIVFERYLALTFDTTFIAIIVGAMQNILSKSSKYSLFDATKEMAYIPLSPELKIKGKATVEILGTKIGKSLVSLIHFVAFTIPGVGFENIYPFLMVIFLFIIIIWLIDVRKINKQYKVLINEKNS